MAIKLAKCTSTLLVLAALPSLFTSPPPPLLSSTAVVRRPPPPFYQPIFAAAICSRLLPDNDQRRSATDIPPRPTRRHVMECLLLVAGERSDKVIVDNVGERNAVGSACTVGERIVSDPPQNLQIDWSAASAASNVAAGSGGRNYPRCVSGGYVGGRGRSGRGESGCNHGGHGARCTGGRGGPLPSRYAPSQGNRSIRLEEDLVN